jgi:hypothetical protein
VAKRKALSRDQVESRKEAAVRFTEDVLHDPDRAAEIEDESVDEYAERKGIEIIDRANPTERRKIKLLNPTMQLVVLDSEKRSNVMARPKSISELKELVADLKEENASLQDQLDSIRDILTEQEEDEEEDEEE